MIGYIFQDWKANAGNSKGRLVLAAYRLARKLDSNTWIVRLIGVPYIAFYKFMFSWVMGIELPFRSVVGPGLRVFHGHALVVHDNVRIGSNVTLRHSTTIGEKIGPNGEPFVPEIGDNVDVGANVVIIGAVKIGSGANVGAGSVVTRSVAENTVVAGNPARQLINSRH
jgi:putative colanic acid biosynthesis acetyltransferase WcaB